MQTDKPIRFSVMLYRSQLQALIDLERKFGCPKGESIRRAIAQYCKAEEPDGEPQTAQTA